MTRDRAPVRSADLKGHAHEKFKRRRPRKLGTLSVQPTATFEREGAVRVAVPELRMTGMQGHTFSIAARFRSYEGSWSEWVQTQQWSVTSDPFTWRNAFQHFFRYSSLAEEDFADGRFVASVAVFDGNGAQLASREVSFRVWLPQLPQAPEYTQNLLDQGQGADDGPPRNRPPPGPYPH